MFYMADWRLNFLSNNIFCYLFKNMNEVWLASGSVSFCSFDTSNSQKISPRQTNDHGGAIHQCTRQETHGYTRKQILLTKRCRQFFYKATWTCHSLPLTRWGENNIWNTKGESSIGGGRTSYLATIKTKQKPSEVRRSSAITYSFRFLM